ncbi:MAG: TauD/TfdA family dioxygenase [Chlamydiales bacterium]
MRRTFITQEQLPLVIEPKTQVTFDDFLKWLNDDHENIHRDLLKYGGVLFRNFPIHGADQFNLVIDKLGLGKPIKYIGGDTPRNKIQGKIYTSTEAPPSLKIPLHNEMSYIKNYPSHIYFHCMTPSKIGGETIIGDARAIYRAIDPKVRIQFEEKKLKYISNFYGTSWLLDTINYFQKAHKTWMDAFETESKEEVIRLCKENDFGYRWNKKNWLQVSYNRPAIIEHRESGEKIWFNQAHLYDYNPRLIGWFNWFATRIVYAKKNTIMHEMYYGDNTPIPRHDLYHIMDILDNKTVYFRWKKGDVMVLDNLLTMHGRNSYKGNRRILVALTKKNLA